MSDQNNNPANDKPTSDLKVPKDFQPMTTATLRLAVPKRDGYHRHWFRGDPGRIAKAMKAGYTFVNQDDVDLNNFDLGGDAKTSGNSDLGSRVSVISGDDVDHTGQPGRLYLMECPEHLYAMAKKIIDDRNDDVAAALRGGIDEQGNQYAGGKNQYMKGKAPDLFTPKTRRT